MKNRHWLELVEVVSLFGLGVGSVASVVTKQLLFTSAPLSFLVLLNLANRRRFQELSEKHTQMALSALDSRITKHIELLNQQVVSLPTPEAIGSLKKSVFRNNREVLEKLSFEIAAIQQEIRDRLNPIEQQGLSALHQEIDQIQEQYAQLSDTLAGVTHYLQRMSPISRMEGLESTVSQLRTDIVQLRVNLQNLTNQTKPGLISLRDQVNHLNRQFQKLPPPVDPTSLKQEVGELIKMVSNLVPRRDWAALQDELRAMQQQQETLRQSIAVIQASALDVQQQTRNGLLQSGDTTVNGVASGQLIPIVPSPLSGHFIEPIAPVPGLSPDTQGAVAAYFNQVQQQFADLQDLTQTLSHQHQTLQAQVNQLPAAAATDLLRQNLEDLEVGMAALKTSSQSFHAQIEAALRQELDGIRQQIHAYAPQREYELVFDLTPNAAGGMGESVSGSRAVLEEALEHTQERLVLVWHWSGHHSLDTALMHKFQAFLQQGRQLEMGWCHVADRTESRFLSSINQQWSIDPLRQGNIQDTLNKLLQLKRSYPDHFRFKILGTSETFIVSDRQVAVLGIEQSLTTSTLLSHLGLKLRTTNPDVIQQLLNGFDNPILDPQDVTAHWNRAVTRYNLGDKAGAIADLNHVLAVAPDDAAAYNCRGLVRYDAGDKSGAVSDFSTAITLYPHHGSAYCNRGFIRAELGDQYGAIADYSLAVQVQPNAIAYFYRGMACQKLGNIQAALVDYTEAIRLEPQSPIPHYYRGIAQQKVGNRTGAIADLETAAKLFLERGSRTNAQKAIANLQKLRRPSNASVNHSFRLATIH